MTALLPYDFLKYQCFCFLGFNVLREGQEQGVHHAPGAGSCREKPSQVWCLSVEP